MEPAELPTNCRRARGPPRNAIARQTPTVAIEQCPPFLKKTCSCYRICRYARVERLAASSFMKILSSLACLYFLDVTLRGKVGALKERIPASDSVTAAYRRSKGCAPRPTSCRCFLSTLVAQERTLSWYCNIERAVCLCTKPVAQRTKTTTPSCRVMQHDFGDNM
jgi:hypothetical protein